jgi:hypothetical protein
MDELPDLQQLLKKHSPSHKAETEVTSMKKKRKSPKKTKKKKKKTRRRNKQKRQPQRDPIEAMEEEISRLTDTRPPLGVPKQAKIISIKEAKMLFGDLPSTHRFWLKSGKPLKNLHELREELKMLGDVLFRHHVTAEKNDFANWVRDCLKNKELAKELYVCTTPSEMIEAIDSYIEKLKGHSPSVLPTIALRPDSSFIRFDIKPATKNSRMLEKDFVIRPVSLKPNFRFIKSGRKKEKGAFDFRFKLDKKTVPEANILPTDSDKLIEEEVSEREKLRQEIEMLTEKREDAEEKLDDVRDEIKEVKKMAPKEIKDIRQEQQDIVRKLRENEVIIKDELQELKDVEVKLEKKKEELQHRSEEIGVKEDQIMQAPGSLETAQISGLPKEPQMNAQDNSDAENVRVDDVLGKPAEPSQSGRSSQGRLQLKEVETIRTPDKEQAQKMIAENKYSPEIFMHIISQARDLIKQKKFERAKNMIEELKKHIDKADLDSKQKRTIYYNLLELSTDLELSSM